MIRVELQNNRHSHVFNFLVSYITESQNLTEDDTSSKQSRKV